VSVQNSKDDNIEEEEDESELAYDPYYIKKTLTPDMRGNHQE
jgi:hypothetical protein